MVGYGSCGDCIDSCGMTAKIGPARAWSCFETVPYVSCVLLFVLDGSVMTSLTVIASAGDGTTNFNIL